MQFVAGYADQQTALSALLGPHLVLFGPSAELILHLAQRRQREA